MNRSGARPHPDSVIAAAAARQFGHVTATQLLGAGIGRGAIAHRVRSGRLIRVHRGVYAVGHVPASGEAARMAAVLACGPGVVLSHHSAAAHWDLRPSTAAVVHITVPGRAGRRPRRAITVHRSTVLPPSEVASHRGIPVTSVARTLLDIAATLAAPSLSRAVERSEILELFDLTAVQHTLDLHSNHPGVAGLTTALHLYRDDDVTRSELEAVFLALCHAHDLPRPLVNATAAGEEVDFLWLQHRLVVETDGRRTHHTRAAFERDRAKDAKLTVAGYRVVRFTYRQIRHDPPTIAATLYALLSGSPAAREAQRRHGGRAPSPPPAVPR